ncbi:MAG: tyrosine-protein phosphatase [Caulobacteraceae bacterium]|nr:tyrosine-protein phosphatase [Caulobacteraceae bacterium]
MDRRQFLMSATAAGAALAAGPAALASAPLEGQAIRDARGLRLVWNARTTPISIFVSSDPDAQRPFMRTLKTGVRGGVAEAPLGPWPRPYFLLEAQGGGEVRVAERLLPLQGGRNFRDLGGYRAEDGRQVRWGRLFRSGVMSDLTAADQAYLTNLGIRVICDLRTVQERRADPNPVLRADAPEVTATDYDMNESLAKLAKATTRAQAIDVFAAAYVAFLDTLTPQYTDMFARLVRREAPLAMNCSAGKDRTGMGSALVLSVLGVPRETVIADYALTETYTPPSFYMKQMAAAGSSPGVSGQQAQAFARMPHEVLQVILGSDPRVMRQALAEIDTRYGGPAALTKARFGLTDAKIAALRGAYLI